VPGLPVRDAAAGRAGGGAIEAAREQLACLGIAAAGNARNAAAPLTMARRPRVLAVASHPIQYHAPWFRGLAESPGIEFSVLFVQRPGAKEQGRGFGVAFEWDVPLLDGYRWSVAPRLRGRGGLRGFFAARIAQPQALLRELAPEAIVLTGWHAWPMVQLLIAARRLRIPVVMRGEANALRRRGWRARLAHRWLLSRCAAFLPIGSASRAFYRAYGIEEQRLFDAPYFVDNERFARSAAGFEAQREALRMRWAVAADRVCFVYAGKLEPKKRILDLLEALRLACANGTATHLLVVGTGELLPQAQAFASEHALPVTFAGFLNQSEIAAAYVAADALVLPSDHGETWGLVVNEAMACGRPVIVSDRVGCGPDLVTAGVTGESFPFGDTAALAAVLQRCAADPAKLRSMGHAARERVLAGYSAARAVEGTLRAVEWVRAPR
jgi:glycosyltransferase involved in cell wall biosynthesis